MRYSRDCFLTVCIFLCILVIAQVSIVTLTGNKNEKIKITRKTQEYSNNSSLPSVLIIGVRKAGTRALLDALGLHPNIEIVKKEAHFFDLNYEKGVEWYQQLMPKTESNQVIIEKTPAYFTNPVVPQRVFEFNKNMKIIIIIRDPVQRIISDFTQVYYNKLELNKTLPIFENEVFYSNFTLNEDYKPVRNSLYHIHLNRWIKYFSLDQMIFVNGDVFRGNPIRELRRVEKFLGLPPLIRENQLVFNEKKGFFCFIKPAKKLKCLGNTKGRPHRPIEQETVEKLKIQLEPHNKKFFSIVNRLYSW